MSEGKTNLSELQQLKVGLADRYEIIRHIGRGATAIVYLARDLRHDRQVAIKLLLTDSASGADVLRFQREIGIIAKLTHPHILPLLDSGTALGRPYYVMPFIEGASLQERLESSGPLPVDEAIQFGREIADALSYAHAAGVLHRDIKPGNILITQGHVLVADFGASRWLKPGDDDETITQPGYGVGTPLYVSPEQGAGDEDLDARSDIYSLGCVIHEMLTGRPPFVGRTSTETIALRFRRDPDPVRSLRREVPVHVEKALLRAMARDPEDRFATAQEFASALADSTAVSSSDTSPNFPSVAVLPFENLTVDSADDHFSRGVSEEIADALARVRNLRVIARTSGSRMDANQDTRAIGKLLGVGALVEGSVRRAGDTVRVSARLIQTSDGRQLWAESYTRRLEDVFVVQAEIAQMVARGLEVELLGQSLGPLASDPHVNLEAHELYLRGRHAWNKRTEEQLTQSVKFFSKAIDLEPRFARAHAGVADTLVTLALYGVREPAKAIPVAEDAAHLALSIDPTLAEAHAALGCMHAIYDWDWEAAEREFHRSMALNPGYATAPHWYAMQVLTPLGRFDDALAQLRHAAQLDPITPSIAASPGPVLYAARRFEESVRWHERTLQTEPRFFPLHHFMGQSLMQMREHLRAINAFEKALALSGGSLEVVASLAHACALSGDLARAKQLLSVLEQARSERYVSPYLLAQVHMGMGERDRALELLEEGLKSRAAEMSWLGVRPIFDDLRNESRFHQILKQLHLSSLVSHPGGSEREC
jgi:serine/threonine-protein kinase